MLDPQDKEVVEYRKKSKLIVRTPTNYTIKRIWF